MRVAIIGGWLLPIHIHCDNGWLFACTGGTHVNGVSGFGDQPLQPLPSGGVVFPLPLPLLTGGGGGGGGLLTRTVTLANAFGLLTLRAVMVTSPAERADTLPVTGSTVARFGLLDSQRMVGSVALAGNAVAWKRLEELVIARFYHSVLNM